MSHKLSTAHGESVCPRFQRAKINKLGSKSAVKKNEAPRSARSAVSPSNKNPAPSRRISKSPNKESFLHKELFSGNAIEVTVKSNKSQQKPRILSTIAPKQTWGKVLKQQTCNENVYDFNLFDPLNTINFLAKELENKVQKLLPRDTSVKQMVSEMQKALTRLPQDLVNKTLSPKSPTRTNTNISLTPPKRTNTTTRPISPNINDLKPEKLTRESHKSSTVVKNSNTRSQIHESSQTPRNIFMEPEKLKKHIEESSVKIEHVCQQMEQLCTKLKADNEELNGLLLNEKETVKSLSKELEELKIKNNVSSSLVQCLQTKNEELEEKMKNAQSQLENAREAGPSKELKEFIQDLQKNKVDTEEECLTLKQQLTLVKMEKKKLETILKARDTQVREIRSEMTQLQEVVNEQLMELKNNSLLGDSAILNNSGAEKIEIKNSMVSNEQQLISGDHEGYKHFEPRTAFSSDSNYLLSDSEVKPASGFVAFKNNKQNEIDFPSSTSLDSSERNLFNKFSDVKNKALASISLKNK